MTTEFNASELFGKIIWRRLGLGSKALLSDNQFEHIMYSLIKDAARTPGNANEIIELHKLKNYLKLFYLSGPCMENRLSAYVRNCLKAINQPHVENRFDSATPIVYVYTPKRGTVPVARRAPIGAESFVEDARVVQESRARLKPNAL